MSDQPQHLCVFIAAPLAGHHVRPLAVYLEIPVLGATDVIFTGWMYTSLN